MTLPRWLAQLADGDPVRRQAAADALVTIGADAVPGLVTVLRTGRAPGLRHAVSALQRIGEPAFQPLVEALAEGGRGAAVRIGMVLEELDLPDLTLFGEALRHPSPTVRAGAVDALGCRYALDEYVDVLLTLLHDPDEAVRGTVEVAFSDLDGDEDEAKDERERVVTRLREIRRSGRRRRDAMTALALVGGWAVFEEVDRDLLRRLIRTKIRYEVPEPMHLCGSWYALPTADQAAVLDAFGLSSVEPVTMRLGAEAWLMDRHSSTEPGAVGYVTPVLDGWTLVFGGPWDGVLADPLSGIVELSRRFGRAHRFSEFEGYPMWCIAEGEELLRYYNYFDVERMIGPPHPAEAGYRLPHVNPSFPDGAFADVLGDSDAFHARYEQFVRDQGLPPSCGVTDIAGRVSVDPSALGPHTRVTGHAVLALTDLGRRKGMAPGALPI